MPSTSPHRRATAVSGPAGSASPVPPAETSAFDALVARTAGRLRPACRSMPAAALDALARTVVLDAARTALRWAEE